MGGFVEPGADFLGIAILHFDFQELAHAHVLHPVIAHVLEGALHGFSLRIEDGLIDEDFAAISQQMFRCE